MKIYTVYIASSWKNAAGVELLTDCLRGLGFGVVSWVENNYGEDHNHVTKKFSFEDWVRSTESDQSFRFDVNGAMTCDFFIYYGPAGKDACAELGAAYAAGRFILGLRSKGEDLGLMRKMVGSWFDRIGDLTLFMRRVVESEDANMMKALILNQKKEI